MHEFDNEELKLLLFGKFSVRKCPECDNNGAVWYDGETGIVFSGNVAPKNIDPVNIAWDSCEECGGLGYLYKLDRRS